MTIRDNEPITTPTIIGITDRFLVLIGVVELAFELAVVGVDVMNKVLEATLLRTISNVLDRK